MWRGDIDASDYDYFERNKFDVGVDGDENECFDVSLSLSILCAILAGKKR